MKTFVPFSLLVLIGAVGCQTKGPKFDPRAQETFSEVNLTNAVDPAMLKPSAALYRLGPGDVFDVEVLGEDAGASHLIVGPDGKIYYSLLPGLSVWGLTLSETQNLLEQEMARFAKIKPNLIANLRAVGSRKVWMLGGTANSAYALSGPATLLEAIASVSSPPTSDTASSDAIDFQHSFVLREGQRVPVDFERLLKQGDLRQNIYLEPDDFIYMPAANQPNVYVLGAVAGSVVVPYHQGMTLMKAMATAGSTIKYAYSTHVAIIRGGLTHPQIAELDYKAIEKGKASDVRLEPGDIVYVRYFPGRKLVKLAEDIIEQFVRTMAANEGIYVGGGDTETQPSFFFGTQH